jgi:hypothetical protein
MKIKNYFRLVVTLFVLILLGSFPISVFAEIIDDITVQTDENGEVDLTIKFAVQIQYLRHFPEGNTPSTEVYFNVLNSVPAEQWQNYESRRVPPASEIQDITVSTMDKATGPKVQIKFKKPFIISVSIGNNGQSLVVHYKSDTQATLAAPIAEVKHIITSPVVVLPPSARGQVHIPLGGKDGLPVFPDVDSPISDAEIPLSETPTLAELIIRANNQAAAFMIQGGNRFLAGQAFAAVDEFNSILKLQPNKYTEDAQLWVGIARERMGQAAKAVLEYTAYLKLYPNGRWSQWVKNKINLLKELQPGVFIAPPKFVPPIIRVKNTEFEYSEFGSLSVGAYLGANTTTTSAVPGTSQAPTSFSSLTQKSMISNVNLTARAMNNQYENRFVFQDFYSGNYLPGQEKTNRLGAAYYELKDRTNNYSFKVGRQSGMGGGVMGRFDGLAAGYGINQNYNVNVVAGQLSDVSRDSQPKFYGTSLDFGARSPIGGTVYFIEQTVEGLIDRKAIGGNVRYFEPSFSIMSMFDYDLQFRAMNFFTLQGTINGGGKGDDYSFLVDRRRSPILDLRNAISGTAITLNELAVQNQFSIDDLLRLANERTTTTNSISAGMVSHLSEKWNYGTDISATSTDGLAASGTIDLATGTVGTEGFVPETPPSGISWTVSQRLTGMGVLSARDVTNFSISLSKSQSSKSEAFQFSNHTDFIEKWTLDTSMGVVYQSDISGGKSNSFSPSARVSYKAKRNLTLDSQLGLTWSKTSSSALLNSSSSFQDFVSFGFRLDF